MGEDLPQLLEDHVRQAADDAVPDVHLLGRWLQWHCPSSGPEVDVAVVAAADPPRLRAHARARGWGRLRLLSCADNTFQYDLGAEDEEGTQDSTVSVFTLDPDGTPRHFYSAHPRMAEDVDQRGIDMLNPLWHLLDLTPQGRGDRYAALSY